MKNELLKALGFSDEYLQQLESYEKSNYFLPSLDLTEEGCMTFEVHDSADLKIDALLTDSSCLLV